MVWIVGIHMVGWSMGQVFRLRVGFQPVWFFDCTACVPVGPAVPRGGGPLAGLSLFVVVAVIASVILWRRLTQGTSARAHQVLAAIAGAAMAAFGLIAFSTRYPGSLPSVGVATIPAALAAGLFFGASGPAERVAVGPITPARITRSGRVALLLGVVSVVTLGGLISVAAVVAGALAWERAPTDRDQRYAGLATALGISSAILRWTLVNRYGWLELVY